MIDPVRRARGIGQSVPTPPGVVMVAPPTATRNAEGRKAKAALVEDGPVQRGQQYKHYMAFCNRQVWVHRDIHLGVQPVPQPPSPYLRDVLHTINLASCVPY